MIQCLYTLGSSGGEVGIGGLRLIVQRSNRILQRFGLFSRVCPACCRLLPARSTLDRFPCASVRTRTWFPDISDTSRSTSILMLGI